MLGEKLMRLRKKQGYSQQEVADKLSVSRQTISNWECDQALPAVDKAMELAQLYNISLDDLMENEIEKLKKNDVKNIEKEIKETDRIKNILAGLKQCDCELIVKETMFLIDVPYSVEGKIIDLDDDWVLIVSMGRKTISRMIRITMIKDVIELTK